MKRLLFFTALILSKSTFANIDSANSALKEGRYTEAAVEFSKLAKSGDALAQANLGYLYYIGEGVKQNYEKAIFWYKKSADQGNRDAQYNLAVAYTFGEGVALDLDEAALWYFRAAKQGHVLSQYSLGIAYIYGEGAAQDSKEAVTWFQRAADNGYAPAQLYLANMYHIGEGVKQDYQKAARWYQMAANSDNAAAQYNLGMMYRSGKGVEKDAAKAAEWFSKSANQGYTPAQTELSNLEHLSMPSVTARLMQKKPMPAKEVNPIAVSARLKKSINSQNDLPVSDNKIQQSDKKLSRIVNENNLISIPVEGQQSERKQQEYTMGAGIRALLRRNYKQAITHFIALAESGNADAQAQIAKLYYTGKGVKKDFKTAFDWYQKAALQGNMNAQYHLGNMYLLGEGVGQNDADAEKWYRLASEQGHVASTKNLLNIQKLDTQNKEIPLRENIKQNNKAAPDVTKKSDTNASNNRKISSSFSIC